MILHVTYKWKIHNIDHSIDSKMTLPALTALMVKLRSFFVSIGDKNYNVIKKKFICTYFTKQHLYDEVNHISTANAMYIW